MNIIEILETRSLFAAEFTQEDTQFDSLEQVVCDEASCRSLGKCYEMGQVLLTGAIIGVLAEPVMTVAIPGVYVAIPGAFVGRIIERVGEWLTQNDHSFDASTEFGFLLGMGIGCWAGALNLGYTFINAIEQPGLLALRLQNDALLGILSYSAIATYGHSELRQGLLNQFLDEPALKWIDDKSLAARQGLENYATYGALALPTMILSFLPVGGVVFGVMGAHLAMRAECAIESVTGNDDTFDSADVDDVGFWMGAVGGVLLVSFEFVMRAVKTPGLTKYLAAIELSLTIGVGVAGCVGAAYLG